MLNNSTRRMKVYLAGPLFSEAERTYNKKIKSILEQYIDVYLPQEDGGLLVEMVGEGVPVGMAKRQVFQGDMLAIRNCDVLIIILDGRAVDEGAAFELGCAYTLNKPCFGLKTDPRQLMVIGDNPMVEAALKKIFFSVSELERYINGIVIENTPITKVIDS